MPLDPATKGMLAAAAGVLGPVAAIIGGVSAGLGLVLSVDKGSLTFNHLSGLDYGSSGS